MARLTSAWTRGHLVVAAALLSASLAAALAVLAPRPYDVVGLSAVGLTVLAALGLDAFGGLVAGFVGAALVIAVRQAGGAWTGEDFPLALSLTLALVLLGWLTGSVSTALRGAGAGRAPRPGLTSAAGSLGLLPADAALARLDEEVARARRHRRPLSLVLVRTQITEDLLPADARRLARRTVARLVEGLVPDTAVPFALDEDVVGAVLPETAEASAWELLGPVVDAATHASFAVRADGERRAVVDCAQIDASLVALSPRHADAGALLAEARQGLAAEPTESGLR